MKIKIFFHFPCRKFSRLCPYASYCIFWWKNCWSLGHFSFPEPKYIICTVTLHAIIAVFRFSSVHIW